MVFNKTRVESKVSASLNSRKIPKSLKYRAVLKWVGNYHSLLFNVPPLKSGVTFAVFHADGNLPLESDALRR